MVNNPINEKLLVVGIFFMTSILMGVAYRMMPENMVRGTVDACVALSMCLNLVGLVVSFSVWWKSF